MAGHRAVSSRPRRPRRSTLGFVSQSRERQPRMSAPRSGRNIALVVIPCVTAAALAVASQLVYQRQGVGLDVGVDSTPHMLVALGLLVVLTLATTFIALGRSGRSSEITSLLLVASLVAPVYAAITLINPLHASDPFPPPVGLSPVGCALPPSSDDRGRGRTLEPRRRTSSCHSRAERPSRSGARHRCRSLGQASLSSSSSARRASTNTCSSATSCRSSL